jgi:LysM repeat protein
MKLLTTGAALSLLSLALLATACGGGKTSSFSRVDPGKIPMATLPANLPEPLIIEGMPTARAVAPSGDTYTVESGDSLYAIAEKLGTTVDELMALNDLTSNDLAVGQVLRVPGGESRAGTSPTPDEERSTPTPRATEGPEATETPAARTTPREGQTEYVVQSGDNANDIALRFGVTVEELAAANDTTVDNLRSLEVGQVLLIPPASTTPAPEEPESTPAEEATPAPE